MQNPRVSVGIPVYNGENYLAEALDSLLAQTFTDFEIIVSDNASTDSTEEIVQTYMARTPKIRYYRNETNLGAAKNYNVLVTYAQGEYFKWMAHDDLIAPTYLEKCVAVLDQDPSYILAYTRGIEIDAQGQEIKRHPPIEKLDSVHAPTRFFGHVCTRRVHQNTVFGVIRTAVLCQTQMIGAFSSSDRVLNGELALHGRFYEAPEYLFIKRNHPQTHWQAYKSYRERIAWYDPTLKGKVKHPRWRLMAEHLKTINRAPITLWERLQCRLAMVWWVRLHWRLLFTNMGY